MITGDEANKRFEVYFEATTFYPAATRRSNIVSISYRRGSSLFGPYSQGSDVGTAQIVMFTPAGSISPSQKIVPGGVIRIRTLDSSGASLAAVFVGVITNGTTESVRDPNGVYSGTRLIVYATDQVEEMQKIIVPGVVTASKYQTWEQRITNTLGPYFTGSVTVPSTATEAHTFRLVDNNVDGSLVDQLDLACNSVGATWYVDRLNTCKFLTKGSYVKTGLLFTDTPGYWNSGNAPVNAGPTYTYNLTYQQANVAFDMANITNVCTVENIMPKNMITSVANGTLRYKDPTTTPGSKLDVLNPTYTTQNTTSVSYYGPRERQLTTNLYPYKSTDTESYYVRFNAALDPGNEYANVPQLKVGGTMANATVSNVTPRTGTYCTNVTVTTPVQSFGIDFGPSDGYPLKAKPTSNINPFQFYFRTSIAKARYRKGIVYLDSAGRILSTQVGGLITPTVNVWGTNTTVFMNYTTIPAGAVSWRPIMNIESSDGTNFAVNDVFKFDDYAINPVLDTVSIFSGDDVDTTTTLYSWDGSPGNSYSYMSRNVLDDCATEVLNYWGTPGNGPNVLVWNAREDYDALSKLEPGARIDVYLDGVAKPAWINTINVEIDKENTMVTLELASRPSSWN